MMGRVGRKAGVDGNSEGELADDQALRLGEPLSITPFDVSLRALTRRVCSCLYVSELV